MDNQEYETIIKFGGIDFGDFKSHSWHVGMFPIFISCNIPFVEIACVRKIIDHFMY